MPSPTNKPPATPRVTSESKADRHVQRKDQRVRALERTLRHIERTTRDPQTKETAQRALE